MSGRAQVRLDEDVVELLDARRGDRSLAQETNRLLRSVLGAETAAEVIAEQASSIRAPSGSLRPSLRARRSNAGWQG